MRVVPPAGSLYPRRIPPSAAPLRRTTRNIWAVPVVVQPAAALCISVYPLLQMPTLARRPWAVVSKMAADQLFMAPLGTAAFFAWTKATEGKANEALPFIQVNLPPGWFIGCFLGRIATL